MPYITGKTGTGTASYLTDENGQPVMLRCDTIWGLPVAAGAAGGAVTWQSDIDNYTSIRASQGFNAMYIAAVATTNYTQGATTVDGATWDGVLPFISGDPGSLNGTYWQRIDYIMASALAQGVTVLMNIAATYAIANAGGPLNGKTVGQWTNYGTALGNRYGAARNLVWVLGDDYFDDLNSQYGAAVTAIKATGDTHLFSYENYPETSSRKDMSTGVTMAGGTANADFSFVYSYNTSYQGIEDAWKEASPIPVIRGDGYYESAGGARDFMRTLLWWCLSSGARGFIYGNENVWPWSTSALATMTLYPFSSTDFRVICNAFTGLVNWHKLVPDTASAMVTAGRGTHSSELVSGGSATAYSGGNTYVTAAVATDKTLAVIYIPSAATVTVSGGAMLPGYGAKWLDPQSGATTVATIASTYSNPAANSAGAADWVLVLAIPPYATWVVP